MWTLTEEIAIDAAPEAVFDIVTDFDRYADWNPWIRGASGSAQEGAVVDVDASLGGERVAHVKHRVLESQRPARFKWCDTGWFTAFAYGERARFLTPRPGGGASYRVELRVTGVAWRLVRALYGGALASGMKAETDALKRRAEAAG